MRNGLLVLGLTSLLATACALDERSNGLEDVPITVSEQQEQTMCEQLAGGSSTGQLPKTAGTDIGEGGAIDATSGLKTIELVEFGGQLGGFVRLSVSPDSQTAVFAMLADDVPFTPITEDGVEVDLLDPGETVCSDAAGRFLWVVADSENHLRFGPTELDTVRLVLETVD